MVGWGLNIKMQPIITFVLLLAFSVVLVDFYRTSPRLGVIFDMISVKACWERWCRWNWFEGYKCTKKRHFLLYQKRRHDAQITWPYAYYVTLGSCCKMANSSSEDETGTLPERPTRIQSYQFEPVRQDFERVPERHVSFEANPMRYSMGFAKSHSLKCSRHKWAWCGAARKSAHLNCINLIHFRLTAGRLCGSSCIVIPGVVCELLQFAAPQ